MAGAMPTFADKVAALSQFFGSADDGAPLTETRKRRRRRRRLVAARAARDAKPILHCAWGCGRPVHAECIERWLRQKNVCVFCNAPFR